MGGALIRGIVKGNADGKYKLFAYDINRDALDQLARETGLTPCGSNIELVCSSDIIFLAVKPRYAKAVLEEIGNVLGSKILVTIVVGLPISWYKDILGHKTRVCDYAQYPALLERWPSYALTGPSHPRKRKALWNFSGTRKG